MDKEISLLFNMLSRLFIAFLPSTVVRTQHFHCQGPGFNLWLRSKDPATSVAQSKEEEGEGEGKRSPCGWGSWGSCAFMRLSAPDLGHRDAGPQNQICQQAEREDAASFPPSPPLSFSFSPHHPSKLREDADSLLFAGGLGTRECL